MDRVLVVNEPVENVFCATGPGGGIDPTCSPRGAAYVGGVAQKLKSGKHSAETVQQLAPMLEGLSKSEVAQIAVELDYPTIAKVSTKKEMIKRIMSNLEGLAMSRLRIDIIEKMGGPDSPIQYDPNPFVGNREYVVNDFTQEEPPEDGV